MSENEPEGKEEEKAQPAEEPAQPAQEPAQPAGTTAKPAPAKIQPGQGGPTHSEKMRKVKSLRDKRGESSDREKNPALKIILMIVVLAIAALLCFLFFK